MLRTMVVYFMTLKYSERTKTTTILIHSLFILATISLFLNDQGVLFINHFNEMKEDVNEKLLYLKYFVIVM